MVKNHYRWDFVGLSTDTKPTPENSEKVTNGSTYYCSDTSKLYVWCDTQWYERKPLGGGGGGGGSYTAGNGIDITNDTISVDTDTIQEKLTAGTNITIDNNVISSTGGGSVTPVQTTGTSTTDVMSQNATSSMLFADPGTDTTVRIGDSASATGTSSVVIGQNATDNISNRCVIVGVGAHAGNGKYDVVALGNQAYGEPHSSVSIGRSATVGTNLQGGIALGAYSTVTRVGELNIGTSWSALGYNNTNYRVLGGVHDPVDAHDAATKGYVDSHAGGSGFTTLTTEDYNWNSSTGTTGTPNCVALWLLPSGIYKGPADSSIEVRATRSQDYSMGSGFPSYAIVKQYEGVNNRAIVTYFDGGSSSIVEYYSIDENGQNYSTKRFPDVVQSTGTSTTNVMSQKAVTDALSALEARIAALEGA